MPFIPTTVTRHPLRLIVSASLLALSMGMQPARADDVSELQALLAAGKASEGLKKADKLLSTKPDDPRLRLQRGIALTLLNRNAEAVTVFQKLIESHPELPGPYNNLAVLYGNQGEYEKARQALELAIRTNPAYATAFQNLGDVYARLAGQAYKKALALDKSDGVLPLKLSVVQNVFETSVDPRLAKAMPPAAPLAAPTAAPTPAKDAAPLTSTAPVPAQAGPVAVKPPAVVAAAATPPTATPTSAAAPAKPPAPAPTPVAAKETKTEAKSEARTEAKADSGRKDNTAADKQAVESALQAWAKAWGQRDMAGYFAAYTPDFKGKAGSRKAWEQERRERITGKKNIKVKLSDIRIKLESDNKASVSLRQDYSSDALNVRSGKTLRMSKGRNGRWQISEESAR